MKIFFSVGEPSGDLHGANLIRELRGRDAGIECVGFGGPKMAAAGCQLHEDLTQFAVMWFFRVLLHLPYFLRLLRRADQYFKTECPEAVVLIDYPGFNWWIARRARRRGIPVYYYGTPQLWAWAPWRVRKMRKYVDHVLCKLPFEVDWFRARGCPACYVGHPYFDELSRRSLDEPFREEQRRRAGALVTILPGSRSQEVTNQLPLLLAAARRVQQQVPNVRFAIASYNERQAATAREVAAQAGIAVDVFHGRTLELMSLATCCMACSGSVSLELLYFQKPTVIYYRLHPWLYALAWRFLIQVRFITLVNLLAHPQPFVRRDLPRREQWPAIDEMLMPEYHGHRDCSAELAGHVVQWLTDAARRTACEARLAELRSKVAHPGATQRAADYLLQRLDGRRLPRAA